MNGEHGPVLPGTYLALALHIREGKKAEIRIGVDRHQQYHQIFGYFYNQIGHKPHSTPRLKCPLVKSLKGTSTSLLYTKEPMNASSTFSVCSVPSTVN